MGRPFAKAEKETTIQMDDEGPDVRLWSCQSKTVRFIKSDKRWTIVREGTYDNGVEWVEATIPVDRWTVRSGMKRTITLTDEQRQARSDNMRYRLNKKEPIE